MASSSADSNQVGATKRFRHAVDNIGDRAMSMFVVSTVKPLCTVTALTTCLTLSHYRLCTPIGVAYVCALMAIDAKWRQSRLIQPY